MATNLEDYFMKSVGVEFINDFNEFFNLNDYGKVIDALPTEIKGCNAEHLIMDHLFLTDENYLLNYEYQSTYIKAEDRFRFSKYGISSHITYKKEVITRIISTIEKSKQLIHHIGPGSLYKMELISLKEMDGCKKLKILENKILNKDKLNNQDYLTLLFLPLMEDGNTSVKILFKVLELVNKLQETNKKKAYNLKGKLIILIDKIIKDQNLRIKLKGGINMGCPYINEFVEPDFDNKIEAKIQRGMERGLKEGKKEGIKEGEYNKTVEIAKNLLKLDMDITDVIKSTGLSKEEINKLI